MAIRETGVEAHVERMENGDKALGEPSINSHQNFSVPNANCSVVTDGSRPRRNPLRRIHDLARPDGGRGVILQAKWKCTKARREK